MNSKLSKLQMQITSLVKSKHNRRKTDKKHIDSLRTRRDILIELKRKSIADRGVSR